MLSALEDHCRPFEFCTLASLATECDLQLVAGVSAF